MATPVERVWDTITRDNLIAPGDAVLVAVSGGADSIALVHLLVELRAPQRLTLHLVHLNHRLRPEADEDAAFVQAVAASLELPVTVETADVRGFAAREKRSLEDAGRAARYACFARVAARVGTQRVATAHTQDDQVETVAMRLLQGAPWDALTGIPRQRPLGAATVVRPLADLTRSDVLAYLRARGLPWREDPTNRDRRFLRNRVRLDTLPALDADYPQLRPLFWRLGEGMGAVDNFLLSLTREAFGQMARHQGDGISLVLAGFQRAPRVLQRRLVRQAVKAVTGTNTPLPRVLEDGALRLGEVGRPGREMDVGVCVVRCGYDALEIIPYPRPVPKASYQLPVPGSVIAEGFGISVAAELIEREEAPSPRATAEEAYLDAATAPSPLHVRSWRYGDRFVPLGAHGRKKLQDFFVDQKVPRWDRGRVPLITDSQDRILWVVGHRIAEPTRVTDRTQQVVRIRVAPLRRG